MLVARQNGNTIHGHKYATAWGNEIIPTLDCRYPDDLMCSRPAAVVVLYVVNPLNMFNKPDVEAIRYRAVAGGTVVAEASATEIERLEGNVYFPREAVDWNLMEPSERASVCPWKGVANYYDVIVDSERFAAAAWTYKSPSPEARQIAGRIAFWRGVRVIKT